jgi:cell division septum initiation protein DivIVA
VHSELTMTELEILKAELEQYQRKNAELETRVEELTDFVENAPSHCIG